MSFKSKQTLLELYLNCQDELENLLFWRLPCRETASDISQEAFVRLCRVDDLGSIDNLKAYLFRTALNLLLTSRAANSLVVLLPNFKYPAMPRWICWRLTA